MTIDAMLLRRFTGTTARRAAVAGLVLPAVAVAGCSHGAPVMFEGRPVSGLPTAVAAADSSFRDSATAAKATLVSDSRCYLTEAGTTITGGWCGPAAYPGDPLGAYWQTMRVTSGPASAPALIVGTPGDHGQPAPVGVSLIRPGEGTKSVPAAVVRADASVLQPGQVAVIDSPAVPLAAPADGRLRGLKSSVIVDGIARTLVAGQAAGRSAHAGPSVVTAGPGRVLVVASFTINPGDQPPGIAGAVDTSFGVVADGVSIPINGGATGGGGQVTVAVSVANPGGSAVLTMTEGPLTERFDLMAGRRVEPAPAVLYRDAQHPFVILPAGQAASAKVTVGGKVTAMPVTLKAASLEEVAPDGSLPPDAAHAWLVAQIDGGYEASAADGSSVALYEARTPFVRAVLPDGSVAGSNATGASVKSYGFLPPYVWFAVPADSSDLKLVLDGTTDSTGGPATVSGATFDVPIPPVAAVTAVPAQAASLAAALGAQVPAPIPEHPAGYGSGGGWRIAGGLAVLVFAGAGIVLAVRRRQPRRASPHPGQAWAGLVAPSPTTPDGSEPPVADDVTVAEETPADRGHVPVAEAVVDVTDGAEAKAHRLMISLLGPPSLGGTVNYRGDRQQKMEEIAYFLAAVRRGVTVEELQTRVWRTGSTDREVRRDTVVQTMSRFRKAVGLDRVSGLGDTGYEFTGDVDVDWWRFTDLVIDADRALRTGDTAAAVEALSRAMALVGGRPFEGATADGGPWVWVFEGGILSGMQRTIADAAHRLAGLALTAGDAELAGWAASQGLRAEPLAEVLWEDRLEAAAMMRDRAEFERVRVDAVGNLGSLAERSPVAVTYRRLREAMWKAQSDAV